jgi:protein TonB
MLTSVQRLEVRSRPREVLGPTLVASLALHLALLMSFLIIRSEQIPLEASAPPSVEVMAEIGTAEGENLPTPSDAPTMPTEALPTAPIPPPPPPAEPPPPPTAALPPSPPAVAKPVHTRTVPLSRAKTPGPKAVVSAGAPLHSTEGVDASTRMDGANRRTDWMGKLGQWWNDHRFYPKEASTYDEGGVVRVHMVIDRSGWIRSVDVVHGSGSDVLDRAAVDVFRDAHLPPFPPGTPDPPTDVEVTLHYNSSHRGG